MAQTSINDRRTRDGAGSLQPFVGTATLIGVLVSAIALGANRPAAWSALSLWVMGMFILQIVLDLRDPPDARRRRVLIPALLFVGVLAWGLLQIWPGAPVGQADPAWLLVPDAVPRLSSDPVQGAHVLMRLCVYGMVFWILARTAETARHAQALLVTTAVFSSLLAAAGIAWAFTGNNPILGEDANFSVSATFVGRNAYATYAILGLVANIALYMERSAAGLRAAGGGQELRDTLETFFGGAWIFALGALVCFSAILLSQSRAGSISAVLAIATVILAVTGDRRARTPLVLGVTVSLVVFAGFFLSAGVSRRLMATEGDEIRFALYDRLLSAIGDRPITGHGLGSFEDGMRAYLSLDLGQLEWDFAHNTHLETVFELGLPGALALYAALGWITVTILLGVVRRRRNRAFSCTALACLVGTGFHAIFDFGLQMPATAALLAAIMGMGWMQSFPAPRAQTNDA
jgi:O-antigen ligase